MYYPTFKEVYDSTTFEPCEGVVAAFPQSFSLSYPVNVANEVDLAESNKDPIVDGLVIGRAHKKIGNYSLLGMALVDFKNSRFLTPFYADSRSRQSFLDRYNLMEVNIDSLKEVNLEKVIKKIRNDDKLFTSKDMINLGSKTLGTAFTYGIFGDMFGITDLVQDYTGVNSLSQILILSSIIGYRELSREKKGKREDLYLDLSKSISKLRKPIGIFN